MPLPVMAVLGGIQLATSLGTAVFSWVKSRKLKKQNEAVKQYNAQQMAQTQAMVQAAASQTYGTAGGINAGYMTPSGFGQPGAGYGPAPNGFYPAAFS